MTTALITGATSGIGKAIAAALDEAGYQVYAVGRTEGGLNRLRSVRPRIVPILVDLTDRDAVEGAICDLDIDVLINNAGVMPPVGPFAEMSVPDIDSTLEVNLSSVVMLTRLIVPRMLARGSGHILFTGSSSGHAPAPNFAVYAATKAAVSGFCASLRAELSPSGIRVTELVPGRVETELYKGVLDGEARRELYAGDVAVQPEDISAMVVALLALPPRADVTRLDIMPTRPTAAVPIRKADRTL